MRKEDFIERWRLPLQGLLFQGYMYGNTDAGMRYRQMELDNKKLMELIARMFDDMEKDKPAEPVKNGPQKAPPLKAHQP